MPEKFFTMMSLYFPELFGGIVVAFALFFLGNDEEKSKNDLTCASLGFTFLAIKNLFSIFVFTFKEKGFVTLPDDLTRTVTIFIQSTAVVLMIVGGLQSLKKFKFIGTGWVLFVCLIAMVGSAVTALHVDSSWQNILPSIYLVSGLVFLGGCFILPINRTKQFLKGPGLAILTLALYYLIIVTPFGIATEIRAWEIETLLYFLLVFCIILSSLSLLKEKNLALQKELRTSKERTPQIIQASPFPIIISQLKDDSLMLVNEKASILFNINMRDPRKFKTEEYFVDPNARKKLLSQLSKTPIVENFQALLRKPGTQENFWLEMSARVIDWDNEVALYTAFKDVTNQKQHEQDLFEKAVKDPLTGCYNRRQFQTLAKKELTQSWQIHAPSCVIMFDIDFFKKVNDTYGHACGDEVLKALANTCQQNLRSCDIFARYGGEEFIIFLPKTTIQKGFAIAERIRQAASNLRVQTDTQEVRFTISLGIVESSTSNDLEELTKYADSALYASKENGRNQVSIYGQNNKNKNPPYVDATPSTVLPTLTPATQQKQEGEDKSKDGLHS